MHNLHWIFVLNICITSNLFYFFMESAYQFVNMCALSSFFFCFLLFWCFYREIYVPIVVFVFNRIFSLNEHHHYRSQAFLLLLRVKKKTHWKCKFRVPSSSIFVSISYKYISQLKLFDCIHSTLNRQLRFSHKLKRNKTNQQKNKTKKQLNGIAYMHEYGMHIRWW